MSPAPPPLSPPLALLVRLIAEAAGGESTAERLPEPPALDAAGWAAFADLAIGRHLVGPLIAASLDRLGAPEEVRTAFAAAERANTLAATVQIAETRRLFAALGEAGISVAVVKGWPLAARFYPSAEARHVGDLDLLVAPADAARTVARLGDLGFAISPDDENRRYRALSDPARAPRLLATGKHVELERAATGMVIELHWRLMSLAGWPELTDRPGALTVQETEAGPLHVPEDRTNLIYLSVHGALHAWNRLKWLADIAVVARARGPAALAGDLEAARGLRLARPLASALSLSNRLFASPLPDGGLDAALAARTRARIETRILTRLARSGAPPDPRRYAADIRALRLSLASGWAQYWGIVEYDTVRRVRRIGHLRG